MDTMERLMTALQRVHGAFDRLRNDGFDLGVPAIDVPLRGRRAAGGPVLVVARTLWVRWVLNSLSLVAQALSFLITGWVGVRRLASL
jgi:hypothetical protein